MSSRDDDYKPSPYTSILPRVRLSKPKPKLIQVLDVPPLPATSNRTSKSAVSNEIPCRDREDNHPHAAHHVDIVSNLSTGSQVDNCEFIHAVGTADSQKDQQFSTCVACSIHVARYKCPKCSAPYCSAHCYRIHDGNDANPENNLQPGAKNFCTESFYKDRVLGECRSHGSDEDRVKLHGILNRMHQDINEGMDNAEWMEFSLSQLLSESETNAANTDVVAGLNQYNSKISAAIIDGPEKQISDEELAELASFILSLEDDFLEENEECSMDRLQQLKESLPPHLLSAFECALASAISSGPEIGHDCKSNVNDDSELQQINYTWKPWWHPQLELKSEKNDFSPGKPTLDERILNLPPLPTLMSQANNRNLAYNILDVLFATSFALRSVSPSLNNTHASNDAANLLLSQSLVLSDNVIHESVYEALSACAEHFVQMNKTIRIGDSATLSWDTIASDVALITCNRRYVLRLLFEAADLLEFGTECMRMRIKLLQKESNIDKQILKQKKNELEETKRQYKFALKKTEYFQSWCSHMWGVDLCRDISKEVDEFVKHWTMPPQETEESHFELLLGNMLENPLSTGIKYGRAIGLGKSLHPSPISHDLIEVCTKKK